LSTPHFRKPLLALSALGTLAVLFAAVVTVLTSVATWAERDLNAFPFKGEDWLRYLLPSRFEAPFSDRIMLAGASTIRENLRYDLFEAAFAGFDVYNGGISAGTLADTTTALEYVEKIHGAEALPEYIVLGVTLRSVCNIPPKDRPFALGLNLYSPYFGAREEPTRVVLEPKGPLEGLLARARFLLAKQPDRFRIAGLAVLTHWLSGGGSSIEQAPALSQEIDRLIKTPQVARLATYLGQPDAVNFTFLELLQFIISPYKYSLKPALSTEVYQFLERDDYNPEEDYSWSPVYFWDPSEGEAGARARVRRFVEFVRGHNIPTLVVNLPERDVSRGRYKPQSYETYFQLLREELEGIAFVDLREYLDTPYFYDREHTTVAGSIKLSEEVIRVARQTIFRPRVETSGEPGPPDTL